MPVLGLLVSSCASEGRPEPATSPAEGSARLELHITPERGPAPLRVRMTAELVGDAGDDPNLACPSVAWVMDNGDVIISRPAECGAEIPRRFEAEYVYRTAGAYSPYVRLVAANIMPSSRQPVLVLGATPTPAPVAAMPGPTIVLATPFATPGPASAVATVPRATVPPIAKTPRPSVAAGVGPSATMRPASAWVLPASIYYLSPEDGRVWRLPASGAAPEPVTPADQRVTEYDVAANGAVAYVAANELWIMLRGAQPFAVAKEAGHPLWSRDGRQVAYRSDGVWRYQVADGQRERLALEGWPLTWSRDGSALIVQDNHDTLVMTRIGSGAPTRIPLAGVKQAGWFDDRDVFWASGAGLWLVSYGAQLQILTLLRQEATASVFVRPDQRLVFLLRQAQGWRPASIALADPSLAVSPLGAPLWVSDTDGFAWSPDGRHAATATSHGLWLVDAASGTKVPLTRAAAVRPQWRLDRTEQPSS